MLKFEIEQNVNFTVKESTTSSDKDTSEDISIEQEQDLIPYVYSNISGIILILFVAAVRQMKNPFILKRVMMYSILSTVHIVTLILNVSRLEIIY